NPGSEHAFGFTVLGITVLGFTVLGFTVLGFTVLGFTVTPADRRRRRTRHFLPGQRRPHGPGPGHAGPSAAGPARRRAAACFQSADPVGGRPADPAARARRPGGPHRRPGPAR